MKHPTARIRRLDQRGYSLLELMFVVAISGMAIASLVRFTFTTRIDLSRQEVSTDLYSTNSRIGSNLRGGLQSAMLMVANYGGSPDYSQLITLIRNSATAGGAPPPVSFTMPLTASPMNDPNLTGTAASTWGNELMYVDQISPLTFTVQGTVLWGGLTYTANTYSVQRLQLVYVYLTNSNTAALPGLGRALRLVQWRSAPMVQYGDLDPANSGRTAMALSDTCATLVAGGYTLAFDYNTAQNLTMAMYVINSPVTSPPSFTTRFTGVPNSVSQSSWAYLDDYDYLQNFSARPGKNLGRISRSGAFNPIAAPYTLSVAYDSVNPGTNPGFKVNVLDGPGKQLVVPLYATADYTAAGLGGGPGFPGGFEVAMVGASHQRQIYIRRVLMASSGTKPGAKAKTYIAHEATDEITIDNKGY